MTTQKNGLALKDELSQQVMRRRDLTASAKLVLIGILSRVDWSTWKSSTGFKVVSQRDLADLCGTTQATVTKAIAQLEKLKLIERDVFKATKRTAPPVKVNIKIIQEYQPTKIKRYKSKAKSKPSFKVEDIKTMSHGDIKDMSQGDIKTMSLSDKENMSLSIDNNNTSIKYQYINPSLGQECIEISAGNGMANDWGVANVELWGNHLHNDLIINLHNQTDIDTDIDTDKD
jgi:DNA-binding transcriptional regulator YhcF (GntR family)